MDDMFPDMLSKKNLQQILAKLFIRGRKLYIYLVLITQFNSVQVKNIRVSCTHYLIVKTSNKQ